jgi:hypothetical protein
VLNGLYQLYTSQNLLGTIFRVTFTVFYRRIWNIVGKYSILCCDNVIEHDPRVFQISSRLHSIDQVHPGSGPHLEHLENKHLV